MFSTAQQAVVGGAYAYTLQKERRHDTDRWRLVSALQPDQSAACDAGRSALSARRAALRNAPQVLLAMNSLPTLQQRVGNRY